MMYSTLWAILMVLCFGSAYYSLSRIDVLSFSEEMTIFKSIYYSIITATTFGFGDIRPITNLAKFMTILEVLFGFLYIVVLITVFLSFWVRRGSKSETQKES